MADGRACPCSVECSDFRIKSLNPDAFLPHKDNSDLTYDGKRLKWNKNFEDLKYFFEIVVGLNGKGSSTGGNSKKLSNCKSNITITWYYGKQRTLLFQGKDGYLLKDFLIKVCDANSTLKYSEPQSSSKQADFDEVACAMNVSVERTIISNAENLTNQSNIDDLSNISQTDAPFNISKTDDILISSNASTIKELEDFIDKSFCNAFGLPDFAQPTDLSTPVKQHTDGNLAKLESQFFTFKENVEVQLQSLSYKLSEQNNIINSNKQELCKLNCENLHLKSCISELEMKLLSTNTSNANSSLGLYSQMVKVNALPTVNADVRITSSGCVPETNNSQGNVNQSIVDSDLDPPLSDMNNHSKESIGAVQHSISTTKERAATQITQATNDINNIEPKAGKSSVLEAHQQNSIEWLGRLPLIETSNQANQTSFCNTKSRSSSVFKNHDTEYYKSCPTNTKLLTSPRHIYIRNSSGRRPFLKRQSIKQPSYRTSHRHHSLEWLIHLDVVYRMMRQ